MKREKENRDHICLRCREEYSSTAELLEHITNRCWATLHGYKHPQQWTKELKDYVQKALDPVNSQPGWTNKDIIEESEKMIEVNR